MSYFSFYHSNFFKKAIYSCQILPNAFSAIPSLVFLAASFIFFYLHLHRSTNIHTRWRTRLIRDFKFHWIFFNVSRLWFIFLSSFRRLIVVGEEFIEANIPEEDKYFNRFVTYIAVLFVVSSIALVPILLIYVNYFSKHDMPNFLMWVMEDPYLRHEIGIAGHCLERPLRVNTQKFKNLPYRSKRSTSFDTNPWVQQKPQPLICRNCRSMMEHNVVKSIDELLD